MELNQAMDGSTMNWEVSYAQLRSSLQMSSKERTFGSFTMRNPAFEIISKLESIKSIFSIWHEPFAFLTTTKRKVSTVQKRWNIRDILQKCWKGFSGLGQHVVVIINQLLGTFLDNGTCMQWRWFCKFPQPPIPTKRHSLHESMRQTA